MYTLVSFLRDLFWWQIGDCTSIFFEFLHRFNRLYGENTLSFSFPLASLIFTAARAFRARNSINFKGIFIADFLSALITTVNWFTDKITEQLRGEKMEFDFGEIWISGVCVFARNVGWMEEMIADCRWSRWVSISQNIRNKSVKSRVSKLIEMERLPKGLTVNGKCWPSACTKDFWEVTPVPVEAQSAIDTQSLRCH